MRKMIGAVLMVVWIVGYVAVAALVGDRVSTAHWVWQLVYFPIAGLAWILPLKPLLRWMHAKDAPKETPDV
jgi:membrane protein implicated in regulation of membrane protease activity